MSALARSLVDAAAEAVKQSDDAYLSMPAAEHLKLDPYALSGRAAVAAVLETLAAECDPVPTEEGGTSQKLLSNADLRRLAVEAKEDTA